MHLAILMFCLINKMLTPLKRFLDGSSSFIWLFGPLLLLTSTFSDDLREPPSLPAIKSNDEQNKENNLQNIEIVQENVKTLESALNEVSI